MIPFRWTAYSLELRVLYRLLELPSSVACGDNLHVSHSAVVAIDKCWCPEPRICVLSSSGWLDGIRRCAQAEARGSGIKKTVTVLLASYLFLNLVSISVSPGFTLHSPPSDLTFFYWRCIWGCLHPFGRVWVSQGSHPGGDPSCTCPLTLIHHGLRAGRSMNSQRLLPVGMHRYEQ